MSRTAATIQTMSVSGISALTFTTWASAGTGNGYTFANDGRTFMIIVNASAGDRTVTVPNAGSTVYQGITIASKTQVITTAKTGIVWVPPAIYNDSTGVTAVDIDSATSVTFAVVQMPSNFQ